MSQDRPQVWVTTCQVWIAEAETIVLSVVSVHRTVEEAQLNGAGVLAKQLLVQAPQHLDKKVVITAAPLSDEGTIALLTQLAADRPDLARHARPPQAPQVSRGRKR